MVDTLSRKRRSDNMRRIRSKHTKPEIEVRRLVDSFGYRFRLHQAKLPGKPDLVFPRLRKIIEVKGCFWHQHAGCIDSHFPKSRRKYWYPKLKKNIQRDKKNVRELRRLGWRVLMVWECQVTASNSVRLRDRLKRFLRTRSL